MKLIISIPTAIALSAIMFVAPLLTIAALNTLFGLNISYTIGSYLGIMWLNFTTFGGLGLSIRSLKQK